MGVGQGEQLLLYSHLASEIAPGKKIATRFLVLTKTKEPVIEEHVREVEPAAVKRTLAGVQRVGGLMGCEEKAAWVNKTCAAFSLLSERFEWHYTDAAGFS
jgi:hypothetical protein